MKPTNFFKTILLSLTLLVSFATNANEVKAKPEVESCSKYEGTWYYFWKSENMYGKWEIIGNQDTFVDYSISDLSKEPEIYKSQLECKGKIITVRSQDVDYPNPIYFEVKNHSLSELELRTLEGEGDKLTEPEYIELYTSEYNDNGFSKNLNEKEKEIYNNNLKDILSK